MSQIFCWFGSAGAVGKSRCEWRSVHRARVSLGCSFGKVCWSASSAGIARRRSWRGGLCRSFRKWRRIFFRLRQHTASSLSLEVLAFTIGLSILTGLLMGIYPALQASHADLVDSLKEGGRGTSGSVTATALSQNSNRRASGAFGDVACGRGVADHELYSTDTAESRLSASQSLGRRDHFTDRAISRDQASRQRFVERTARRVARHVQASKALQLAAIFRLTVGIARFTRARIAMCRRPNAGPRAESRYCAGIFEDLGNSAHRRT